ncbi:MAG: valine--tRNA ligase [Blastomonas sp.]
MSETDTSSDTQLPKTFDPAAIEARWYAHWEEEGLFRPERPDATPFTIVNPPPNVTGSLHIGHALDNTLQDVVIRYERLRGKDALWVVGTDHAGIATQMVVERQLEQQQDKRTNYSREDFIAKVWEWKEESGGTITRQLRRLGCSMDWANERFTMDPGFSKAVLKVFVDLYNEGLIYRDKRLVNWDPKLKTAISDLEVETAEVQGHFWHFRYPLTHGATTADGKDHIIVATTRPETMLADMAVAVHPEDDRYRALVEAGAKVVLPITGREIPVIADEHADPELGSGAVKITPGHDFNDFEVGKRAGIAPADMLNMLDAEAHVVQTADGRIPHEFIGMERFAARKAVVARLDELGLLVAVEDRVIATPFGDRGGVVIEPWLTDQWYVDAKALAAPAIEAVKSGAIEIVPKSWEKTWFHWMENIQPWCVSRQLWWGHRIPAWYGYEFESVSETSARFVGRKVFVARTEEQAKALAKAYMETIPSFKGCEVEVVEDDGPDWDDAALDRKKYPIWQDPDVLDTWFSSALWPFATLGWPDAPTPGPSRMREGSETCHDEGMASRSGAGAALSGSTGPLLSRHYPNDLLISGFDILFFWDARMAMQGIQFMKDVPWRRLYLHGLVRAADGSKMSKSKGNTVDPLGLIDQYGADALRFFMAAMESQGRDIKMDERRVEGYRNFATKLWNAARFCQANGIAASTTLRAPAAKSAVNRWIIGETVETLAALDAAMADLRFDAAANAIYHFVWDRFCDWYLELIKGQIDEETRGVAGWVLDQILVMLHPFMPFITEELWHAMGPRNYDLIVARWPQPKAAVDAEAMENVEWFNSVVTEIRSARTEMSIPPSARPNLHIWKQSKSIEALLREFQEPFKRLARVTISLSIAEQKYPGQVTPPRVNDKVQRSRANKGAIQIERDGFAASILLEGVIDIAAEKARLGKALEAVAKEAASLEARLGNPNFVERAKPEAVEKARADHAEKAAEAERLQAALDRLG